MQVQIAGVDRDGLFFLLAGVGGRAVLAANQPPIKYTFIVLHIPALTQVRRPAGVECCCPRAE